MPKQTNMQLYVEKATVSSLDVNEIDVYLEGVDESQVIAEIGAVNLLKAMEWQDVLDFVAERQKDDE